MTRATGDRNGSRLHPERLARGDRNPSRLYPERLARGERQGCAKLTEAAVRYITRSYARGGMSQRALAETFGVSQGAVWKVLHQLTWRHVQ